MQIRRYALLTVFLLALPVHAAEITTIAGSGKAGFSGDGGPALKADCNQTFGLEIGPDAALYWCELDNHIIRRMELPTGQISTIAGIGGIKGFAGDQGPAVEAKLNGPHELRFDRTGNIIVADSFNHVVRKIDRKTGIISTVAGTGKPGFFGDGSAAVSAQLNVAISVVLDREENYLICDISNHRIRKLHHQTGMISTWGGTGEKKPTPDGEPILGTPLFGPRTLAVASNGDVIIVLREGHAVFKYVDRTKTLHHVAGTGQGGYSGDNGDAKLAQVNGPKGVAIAANGDIYLADTENHTIRLISAESNVITSLVGNGKPGDGPDGSPVACQLRRPHGIYVAKDARVISVTVKITKSVG